MKIKNEAPATYRTSLGSTEEDKIINQALMLVESRLRTKGFLVTSADLAKFWISQQDWPKDIEQFGMMHLDTKHCLLNFEILFSGTIDATQVYPREVVKSCLAHNSAAVILVHNHPSGDTEPSKSDIALTEKLKRCLEIIEVRVLDHFIVGDDVYSFAENRLI